MTKLEFLLVQFCRTHVPLPCKLPYQTWNDLFCGNNKYSLNNFNCYKTQKGHVAKSIPSDAKVAFWTVSLLCRKRHLKVFALLGSQFQSLYSQRNIARKEQRCADIFNLVRYVPHLCQKHMIIGIPQASYTKTSVETTAFASTFLTVQKLTYQFQILILLTEFKLVIQIAVSDSS